MPIMTRVEQKDAYDLLDGYKRCALCKECKVVYDFRPVVNKRKGVSDLCRKCEFRRMMVNRSRANAVMKGIEHTISMNDIPTPDCCKYLGILLDYRTASERGSSQCHNSPSLDRIDNSKGYTPDNVQTISNLANNMKRDATIEQLIAFANGVLQNHTKM